MSTEAQILAIGPFQKTLAPHLEYPAAYYDDVQAGALITSTAIRTVTRDASREMAEAFGTELFDFGRHTDLKPTRRTFAILRELAKDGAFDAKEVDALDALHRAGFTFHLRVSA